MEEVQVIRDDIQNRVRNLLVTQGLGAAAGCRHVRQLSPRPRWGRDAIPEPSLGNHKASLFKSRSFIMTKKTGTSMRT
jgi:hypothetical protein